MSDRIFYTVFGGIMLVILMFIARNAVSYPLQDRRVWLSDQLERMAEMPPAPLANEELEHLTWERTIVGKRSAWSDLVPPPPPPAPAKPPPATCPDLKGMLKEVHVTRQQIGDKKVKVIHPSAPNGEWLSPGMNISVPANDKSESVTMESFDRQSAVFSWYCPAKKSNLKATLTRE